MEREAKLAETAAGARARVAASREQTGRSSLAFRLLPLLSLLYCMAEKTRVLELAAVRWVYRTCYFWYKRFVEDPFAGLVASRPDLFRDGNVVDVGAHIGYTTALFLRAVSKGFRVYAIEPDAANLRELRATVKRLGAGSRVVVVEAAAGCADGQVAFWHNGRHPGDHRVASETFRSERRVEATCSVPLRRVDSLLAAHGADSEPLAFVKIDAQGCELAVCAGLATLMERNPRLTVAIEYAPAELREQGADPEALLDFFRRRGCALHLLRKDGGLVPLATDRLAAALGRRGYADILCVPDGGN
jgi:FkbM family methyltransferase